MPTYLGPAPRRCSRLASLRRLAVTALLAASACNFGASDPVRPTTQNGNTVVPEQSVPDAAEDPPAAASPNMASTANAPAPAGVSAGGNTVQAGGNGAPALSGPAEVSALGDGNFSVGPTFTADANFDALRAGVAAGTWSTFYVPGANSNYYTGTAPGLKQNVTINRQVQVFVPSGYQAGTPIALLVLMDGGDFQYALKNTLPNLIAAKALPPMVAITVSAGSTAGTYNERSWEYDVVSTRWSDYIENEILPLVVSKYNVTITKNPALRGTLGGSSGGAAALTMGWLRPDRYSRLVTFSGSFVNLWPTDGYPKGAWFFADDGIMGAAKKNLRVAVMVSQNDLNAGSGSDTDWLLANRKVAAALASKNYHYRYTYVVGGGHEEAGALRQALPAQLAWAWRGWEQAMP